MTDNSHHVHDTRPTHHDSGRPARLFALVVGIVFVAVGILGFVPGITTGVDEITFAGHESNAQLLGVFAVSVLHNIVHLLFGIAGIALSRVTKHAVAYLVGGGVIYLLLWIYGLVISYDSAANFIPLNDADNWLHLVLGLGMVALGLVGRKLWHDHDGRVR